MASRSCSAVSPITLPSWDHIARISPDLSVPRRPLALGMSDESDACENRPLSLEDALSVVITLYGMGGIWRGFLSRSPIFGDIVAAAHYNAFSLLLVYSFVRLFGIPSASFFDHFGFAVFANLIYKAVAKCVGFSAYWGFVSPRGISQRAPLIPSCSYGGFS